VWIDSVKGININLGLGRLLRYQYYNSGQSGDSGAEKLIRYHHHDVASTVTPHSIHHSTLLTRQSVSRNGHICDRIFQNSHLTKHIKNTSSRYTPDTTQNLRAEGNPQFTKAWFRARGHCCPPSLRRPSRSSQVHCAAC